MRATPSRMRMVRSGVIRANSPPGMCMTGHGRREPLGRIMINSEMLWTGSTALRPANRDADLGWTDPPPSGRHAGLGDSTATTTGKVGAATAHAPTETITVYLLDDHEIVRLGLKDLLESEGDIQVIGESGSAAHAQAQILALHPQVAVLDGRLPDGSGIDVCREIRSRDPNIAVLILTSFDDDEALFAAIMAGAAGYVLKQIRGSDLIDSVRRVAAGQSLLDPAVTARVLERVRRGPELDPALAPLTDQERRVLSLICLLYTSPSPRD